MGRQETTTRIQLTLARTVVDPSAVAGELAAWFGGRLITCNDGLGGQTAKAIIEVPDSVLTDCDAALMDEPRVLSFC